MNMVSLIECSSVETRIKDTTKVMCRNIATYMLKSLLGRGGIHIDHGMTTPEKFV
jgi:hypothetical protein